MVAEYDIPVVQTYGYFITVEGALLVSQKATTQGPFPVIRLACSPKSLQDRKCVHFNPFSRAGKETTEPSAALAPAQLAVAAVAWHAGWVTHEFFGEFNWMQSGLSFAKRSEHGW